MSPKTFDDVIGLVGSRPRKIQEPRWRERTLASSRSGRFFQIKTERKVSATFSMNGSVWVDCAAMLVYFVTMLRARKLVLSRLRIGRIARNWPAAPISWTDFIFRLATNAASKHGDMGVARGPEEPWPLPNF